MEPSEHQAIGRWILERQLGWIGQADVKVGVVATANVAAIAALAAEHTAHPKATIAFIFAAISFLLSILSLSFCAAALLPRLKGPPRSLIYFRRIAGDNDDAYRVRFRDLTDADVLTDLADQIHVNACIANEKHLHSKRAVVVGFASLCLWIIAVVIYTLGQSPL